MATHKRRARDMEVATARAAVAVLKVKIGGGKSGAGPKHVRSELIAGQIRAFAGLGVPIGQILRLVGISSLLLEKYYPEEVENGRAQAHAAIARTVYQQAIGGSLSAAMFWLRSRAGWLGEGEGKKGVEAEVAQLSAEQRAAIYETLRARLRIEERAKLIESQVVEVAATGAGAGADARN